MMVLLFSLLLASCKDKQEKKPAPVAALAPVAQFKADAVLAEKIKGFAQTCNLDTQRAVMSCPGGEKETFVSEFVTDKRSRAAALETFVVLLQEKDEKVLTATAIILYESTRAGLGEKVEPASLSPAVVGALRQQMLAQAKQRGRLLAPAVAYSSSLVDQLNELDAAVAKNTELEAAVYRHTMVYGGLKAFKKIKDLVQDERSSVRLAALEAPRNMRTWSPKDRAEICPWAEGLLTDQRPMVAARASLLLSRCAGGSVDALLARGEESVKTGQFGRGTLPAYRDLCSGLRRRSGGGATKEQCLRNRKLLETVVNERKLELQARALALSAIAYQWPDAEALKLAQRHEHAKEPELARTAAQTVQLLERRMQAEQKTEMARGSSKTGSSSPGSPPSPSPAVPRANN